jgi:hypothetical protein
MTRDETIKLTVKSLLEVVQTGAKNVEITVMDGFGKLKVRNGRHPSPLARVRQSLTLTTHGSNQNLTLPEIEEVVKEIEAEKEAEAEKKRSRLAATAASQQAMVSGDA